MERENSLQCGNCMDILSKIPDNTFDHFISDVPYKTNRGGSSQNSRRPTGILEKNDGKIFEHNDIDISIWLPMVRRVVKPKGNFLIFTNVLNLCPFIEAIQKQGLKLQEVLLWTKSNVIPNKWYMKQSEYILFASEDDKNVTKQEYIYPNCTHKLHPTEKPVSLMQDLIINFSQLDDYILDCFCGSGSTLVAARECGRRFFGCEIDDNFYQIAEKRYI